MQTPSHRADPRWATRLVRVGAIVMLVVVLTILALAAVKNAAKASGGSGGPPAVEETYGGPDGTYVGAVTPGAPCIGNEGDHGTKDGKPYLCWQKKGQDCPRWHRVIVPGEPTGAWSPRPYASPCPNCSPTPSAPASASTPPATASSAPPTPVGGPQLPLTGTASAVLAGVGVLLLLAGFGLVRLTGRGTHRR